LSWLHPLRSWSLRQTRGGSYSSYCTTNCPTPTQTYLDPLEAEYRELLELRERVRNAEATASGMQPRFDMADRTYDEWPAWLRRRPFLSKSNVMRATALGFRSWFSHRPDPAVESTRRRAPSVAARDASRVQQQPKRTSLRAIRWRYLKRPLRAYHVGGAG